MPPTASLLTSMMRFSVLFPAPDQSPPRDRELRQEPASVSHSADREEPFSGRYRDACVIFGLALACRLIVSAILADTYDPDEFVYLALGMLGLTLLLTRRSSITAILAGLCLALACWIKYPALLFLPIYALAAPRRMPACLLGWLGASALLFAPYLTVFHALFDQSVIWQLIHRNQSDPDLRLRATLIFWLFANPLAVVALLRTRKPAWLLLGFGCGGVFFFTYSTYAHYFVPISPFAALLGAVTLVRSISRFLPLFHRGVSARLGTVEVQCQPVPSTLGEQPETVDGSHIRCAVIAPTVDGASIVRQRLPAQKHAGRGAVAGYQGGRGRTGAAVTQGSGKADARGAPSESPQELTERETAALRLLAQGRANKKIAHSLHIGENTVKTHVSNILAKFGVQSRTQAALYAVQLGLVPGGKGSEGR